MDRSDLPIPMIGDVHVTQIPPAPLSEEDLRLECLSLAVRRHADNPHRTTREIVDLAEEFRRYVRPS